MIRLYCRLNHKQADLCADCSALLVYAHKRLDACAFKDEKPICKKCPTHCYAKAQREKIKQVMRFSGPRMIIYQPLTFIKHIIHK